MGFSESKSLGAGKLTGKYHGTLVCNNMVFENPKWNACEERIRSLTVQKLTKWLGYIPDKLMDGNGAELKTWILPARFSSVKYVNDAEHRVRDRITV